MNRNIIKLCASLLFVLLYTPVTSLEHEKSFLLQDSAAYVLAIDLYKESLLISSSNDIVQKDIETGAIQRTFRAHTNQIRSFVVTSDSRMITSALDDMIVVWDLESGSVIKRTWLQASNTLVYSISYQINQVFAGGQDSAVRQVDLITGKLVKTIYFNSIITVVLAYGDDLYVGKSSVPAQVEKIHIPSSRLLIIYEGHTNAIFALCLSGNLLFSGSADTTIISWNSASGVLINRFIGHTNFVSALVVIGNDMYSAGSDKIIIQWSIDSAEIIKVFAIHHLNEITCLAPRDNVLFSGSVDATVIKWNYNTGLPLFVYRGRQIILRVVAMWKSFVISGGDDTEITLWDVSTESVDPYAVLQTPRGQQIYQPMEFNSFSFPQSHSNTVAALDADNLFLYSGGADQVAIKWNITSGALIREFIGHSNVIICLRLQGNFVFSGSRDSTLRMWETESAKNIRIFYTSSMVEDVFVTGDVIIAALVSGVVMFEISTSELLVELTEVSVCYCLAASNYRLFTGHSDGSIKWRDFNTLSVLETYRGHQDGVNSLCLDENDLLYSASFDGSVKKWDMATRRVAFSFENRSASVSSLTALNDLVFVGTRSGAINVFNVQQALFFGSFNYHKKAVNTLIAFGDRLYSSGMDGLIFDLPTNFDFEPAAVFNSTAMPILSLLISPYGLLFIRDQTEIVMLHQNNTENGIISIFSTTPITCLASVGSHILAGSKSGMVLAWNVGSGKLAFELKGHTSQVNLLLVENGILFSASDDSTIVQWCMEDKSLLRVFKRTSSRALGHLGPVNSLSICNDVLFSGGSDTTVRRWNTQTGKHEDVYFGFSKQVSNVLCYNRTVYAGSDDFSVLAFKPQLPEGLMVPTTTKSMFSTLAKMRAKIAQPAASHTSGDTQPLIVVVLTVILALITVTSLCAIFAYKRTKIKTHFSPVAISTTQETTSTFTDLQTVVNSVLGISKHAAFLIKNSALAQVMKITSGGGGELFTAKVMDPGLIKKVGETVIQKVVFIKNKANEEAFYQEVGIMIMLSTYPHFCQIIGYTENPLSMILKYYPDGSLSDWLRKSRISETAAVIVLREIAEALNVMHTHYLAHCDIKPQNVLLEEVDGVPSCFLTDFGITQVLSDKIVASSMFNVINLRGLSVSYASPEAFRNFKTKKYASVDFKKYDIYSLGMTMYEIIAKRAPWR